MSKTIVELKVYRGKALYDENGKIATPNEKMTLEYENDEFARKKGWENHIGNLPRMGYSKVDLMAIYENGVKTDSCSAAQAIATDVANIFKPQEKKLTPEQKKIAELEAKVEALLSVGKAPAKSVEKIEVKGAEVVTPEAKTEAVDDLKAAREEYEAHFKKKGFAAWDAATLYAKIEEDKLKTA